MKLTADEAAEIEKESAQYISQGGDK